MSNHAGELDAKIAALKAELQEYETPKYPKQSDHWETPKQRDQNIRDAVINGLKTNLRVKEIEKMLQEIRESMMVGGNGTMVEDK